MKKSESNNDIFDSDHYASTLPKKIIRALELGPKYFLWDIPKYLMSRREAGLGIWDIGILTNPLREFKPELYLKKQLPDFFDDALDLCAVAGIKFTIPRLRLEGLASAWSLSEKVHGDVIECGSYRGATALFLALLNRLGDKSRQTYMLDTFAGMPTPTRFDFAREKGEFTPSHNHVEVIMDWAQSIGVENDIHVCKGLFSETFPVLMQNNLQFSLIHIDANIFESTREACEFTIPRVTPGGIVVFDDYNGVTDLGARHAIDSYLRESGTQPRPLTGSAAYLQYSGNCADE